MAETLKHDYRKEYIRYRHYFGRIYHFYEKPAAKVSLALLLTVFTTIFFAVFAIRPTLVTIAELLRTIKDRREVLEKLERKASALATAQQEFATSQEAIGRLNQAIPEESQVSEWLTQVEGVAAMSGRPISGLTVDDFEYGPVPASGSYSEQRMKVTISGDYVTLNKMLKEIVNLPRLITADMVTISPVDQSENEGEVGGLSMDLDLVSYFYPSRESEGN